MSKFNHMHPSKSEFETSRIMYRKCLGQMTEHLVSQMEAKSSNHTIFNISMHSKHMITRWKSYYWARWKWSCTTNTDQRTFKWHVSCCASHNGKQKKSVVRKNWVSLGLRNIWFSTSCSGSLKAPKCSGSWFSGFQTPQILQFQVSHVSAQARDSLTTVEEKFCSTLASILMCSYQIVVLLTLELWADFCMKLRKAIAE